MILTWFTVPYIKLNHLIVWINRNRKINHCNWISDYFQLLLFVTKSKHYSTDDFVLIRTRNKTYVNSIFKFSVYMKLKVSICRNIDGKVLDEINGDFVISFVYRDFRWIVVSIDSN